MVLIFIFALVYLIRYYAENRKRKAEDTRIKAAAEYERKRREEIQRMTQAEIDRKRQEKIYLAELKAAEREKQLVIREREKAEKEKERKQKEIERLKIQCAAAESKYIQAQNTLEYINPEIERITERLDYIRILPERDSLTKEAAKLEKLLYQLNNKAIKADYDISRYNDIKNKLQTAAMPQ